MRALIILGALAALGCDDATSASPPAPKPPVDVAAENGVEIASVAQDVRREITIPRLGAKLFDDDIAEYYAQLADPNDRYASDTFLRVYAYDKKAPTRHTTSYRMLAAGHDKPTDVEILVFGESALISLDCGSGPDEAKADPIEFSSLAQAPIGSPGTGPNGEHNVGERINGANTMLRNPRGEFYRAVAARACLPYWGNAARRSLEDQERAAELRENEADAARAQADFRQREQDAESELTRLRAQGQRPQ